jgi:sodium/hydrogen antiporter
VAAGVSGLFERRDVVLVLTFGVVLLVTVALSGPAAGSVLSTALVFLVAGVLVGPGRWG